MCSAQQQNQIRVNGIPKRHLRAGTTLSEEALSNVDSILLNEGSKMNNNNYNGNERDDKAKLVHALDHSLKVPNWNPETIKMMETSRIGSDANMNHGHITSHIPSQFASDNITFSFDHPTRHPFPRWDFTDSSRTILDSMLDFLAEETETFVKYEGNEEENSQNLVHTSDHPNTVPNWWFPETLYIVDSQQIYVSQRAKSFIETGKGDGMGKTLSTEGLMKRAFDILHENKKMSAQAWPRLHQILIEENGSFPF